MSASKSDCRVRRFNYLHWSAGGSWHLGDQGSRRTMETREADSVHRSIRPGWGQRCARQVHCEHHQGGNLNPTPLMLNNQAAAVEPWEQRAVAQSPGNEQCLLTFHLRAGAAPIGSGRGRNVP